MEKEKMLVTSIFSISKHILAPMAEDQRAYVMVRCPSCVCPSVNFYFNHIFSETTHPIFMKLHGNDLVIVLLEFLERLIPSKTLIAMATTLEKGSL